MKISKLIIVTLLTSFSFILNAQNVRNNVMLRVNSEDGIFKKGEEIKVWADVAEVPAAELTFNIMRWCDWNPESSRPVTLHKGENLLWQGSFDEAVQYVFEVTDGIEPQTFKRGYIDGNAFAGIIVAPEDLKPGYTQPDDFKKFWKKEIKAMRSVSMDPIITNEKNEDGFSSYHVDLNCVGPVPARAYVAHPENAAAHSLPIIIFLHAAGRPGSPSKESTARFYSSLVEGGSLAMDINAHGMLDDQTQEYYDSLAAGPLNEYSLCPVDEKLENYYFKWMMLRAIRAVDYLTQSPLWDGKHIIVTGTSQGGYQSAFLAGIDSRITSAIITVPAGVDQGAHLQGRTKSWPRSSLKPDEITDRYLPYIDPAAFLHNTKADIWCEIGLYDFTCPAANLFSVMNTVTTPKTIITFQRPHSLMSGQAENHGEVDKSWREAFQKAATKVISSKR